MRQLAAFESETDVSSTDLDLYCFVRRDTKIVLKNRRDFSGGLTSASPEMVIYDERMEPHLHAMRHVDVTWIVVKLP